MVVNANPQEIELYDPEEANRQYAKIEALVKAQPEYLSRKNSFYLVIRRRPGRVRMRWVPLSQVQGEWPA